MDISAYSSETDNDAHPPRMVPLPGAILEVLYAELATGRLPETVSSGAVILQGCLPLFMDVVPAATAIERIGQKKYTHMRQLYKESSLLNLWYGLELQQLLLALNDAQIPVMVLKGADLAATF